MAFPVRLKHLRLGSCFEGCRSLTNEGFCPCHPHTAKQAYVHITACIGIICSAFKFQVFKEV